MFNNIVLLSTLLLLILLYIPFSLFIWVANPPEDWLVKLPSHCYVSLMSFWSRWSQTLRGDLENKLIRINGENISKKQKQSSELELNIIFWGMIWRMSDQTETKLFDRICRKLSLVFIQSNIHLLWSHQYHLKWQRNIVSGATLILQTRLSMENG